MILPARKSQQQTQSSQVLEANSTRPPRLILPTQPGQFRSSDDATPFPQHERQQPSSLVESLRQQGPNPFGTSTTQQQPQVPQTRRTAKRPSRRQDQEAQPIKAADQSKSSSFFYFKCEIILIFTAGSATTQQCRVQSLPNLNHNQIQIMASSSRGMAATSATSATSAASPTSATTKPSRPVKNTSMIHAPTLRLILPAQPIRADQSKISHCF